MSSRRCRRPKEPSPLDNRPNKLFYRIGEVSAITGLEPYVLRYWETEFPHLRPEKRKSGQRLYTKKDLENILQVKSLLHEQGFTITGAKKKLRRRSRNDHDDVLAQVTREVRDLLELLT